jgi:site-specific recombinase XerD
MAAVVFHEKNPYLFSEDWTAYWEPNQWLFALRQDKVTISAYTLRDYAYTLAAFLSWCERELLSWFSVGIAEVEEYFRLVDEPQPTTNKKVGIIYDFFVWARHTRNISTLPFKVRAKSVWARSCRRRSGTWHSATATVPILIKRVPVEDRPVINFPSLNQIWAFRDVMTDDRERLIVETLMFTGLRISELLNLRLAQIVDLDERSNGTAADVLITGKGRKRRVVLFPWSLVNRLKAWASLQRPFLFSSLVAKSEYLFIGRQGQLCARTVQKIFKQASGRARVSVHPHLLRHFYAVHYLQYLEDIKAAAPLDQLRALLGHSTMETTQIYLHLTDRQKTKLAEDNENFVAAILGGRSIGEITSKNPAVAPFAREALARSFRRSK